MTKPSKARVARRAKIEVEPTVAPPVNNETWDRAKSLAEAGTLGSASGAGLVSLARLSLHLVKMGSMGVLNSEGSDAKDHHAIFTLNRNGAALGERPGDATKAGQLKNFIKLGELSRKNDKINGEGLLARAWTCMDNVRKIKRKKGDPSAKQTFVGYLETAKAQLENDKRELNDAEVKNACISIPEEKAPVTLVDAWQEALDAISLAAKIAGTPDKGTKLALSVQALVAELKKAK